MSAREPLREPGDQSPAPPGIFRVGEEGGKAGGSLPATGPEGHRLLRATALGLRPRRALSSVPRKQPSISRNAGLHSLQQPVPRRPHGTHQTGPALSLSKAVSLSKVWGVPHTMAKFVADPVLSVISLMANNLGVTMTIHAAILLFIGSLLRSRMCILKYTILCAIVLCIASIRYVLLNWVHEHSITWM